MTTECVCQREIPDKNSCRQECIALGFGEKEYRVYVIIGEKGEDRRMKETEDVKEMKNDERKQKIDMDGGCEKESRDEQKQKNNQFNYCWLFIRFHSFCHMLIFL